MDTDLAGLSPAQRRAATHVDGPLLVLAGPGSGKTRVVAHRIAHLLDRGIAAASILAVTFTNKAAREMRERVRRLVGGKASRLTLSTIHSACARILRAEIEALGYGKDFSIYDESSQESIIRLVLRDLKSTRGAPSPAALLQAMSAPPEARAKAPGPEAAEAAPAADALDRHAALVAAARERYQQELRARNAVDFEGLIDLTARLFRERGPVLARWRQRWRYLLVDEYQDTSRSQEEILALLAGQTRNLCVVGDDDQSIYSWRGAEVEHILRFSERYPGAAVVRLERNYRSTASIVAVARAVIQHNQGRHAKDLHTRKEAGLPVRVIELDDEAGEARFIAHEIAVAVAAAAAGAGANASGRANGPAPFAVLLRTNEQTRPIEQALREGRIPYRLLGGRSFFERKEVLDVLAYLRVASNPADDEALFRIANTPARGVGVRALETIRGTAREKGLRALAVIRSRQELLPGLSTAAHEGLAELVEAVDVATAQAQRLERSLVADLLRRIRYRDEIESRYKEEQVRAARMAMAEEVGRAWMTYLDETSGQEGLAGFLEGLALRARDDEPAGIAFVTLATVHAAKGLEFARVYVAGLEDGTFPHHRSVDDRRSLEEERRLFYVAVTRAMERLTLTRARTRVVRGKERRTQPSRFLAELDESRVDRGAERPAAPPSAAAQVARMRALFASREAAATPAEPAAVLPSVEPAAAGGEAGRPWRT